MESSILCLLEAHLGTTCRYFSPFSHRFLLTRHRFQNLFSTIWFRCVPTVMMPLAHRLDGEPGAPNVPFKTCMPSAASASRHITSHHLYWELCIIWYKRRMYFTLICWCLYIYKYIHFMFTWKKTVLSKTHGSLISFLKMHFGRFFGRSTYRYHGSASRRHFLPQTTSSGSSWMTDVTMWQSHAVPSFVDLQACCDASSVPAELLNTPWSRIFRNTSTHPVIGCKHKDFNFDSTG